MVVPGNAVLVISYVGFRKQEISIAGKSQLDIKLEPVENTMGDVVVVGYTSQRKASITGAVSTVDMEDLSKHEYQMWRRPCKDRWLVFCCSQYGRARRWH